MLRPALLLSVLLGACTLLAIDSSSGQAPPDRVILLNVSQGQLPADTGQDDKTHPEIVANFAPPRRQGPEGAVRQGR